MHLQYLSILKFSTYIVCSVLEHSLLSQDLPVHVDLAYKI